MDDALGIGKKADFINTVEKGMRQSLERWAGL